MAKHHRSIDAELADLRSWQDDAVALLTALLAAARSSAVQPVPGVDTAAIDRLLRTSEVEKSWTPPTTDLLGTITVVLPERPGARANVERFLADVPADLAGIDVIVDASHLASKACVGFIDETVKQLLAERGARSLLVSGASPRTAGFIADAGRHRAVLDRIDLRAQAAA
jgi:hypothetical protein